MDAGSQDEAKAENCELSGEISKSVDYKSLLQQVRLRKKALEAGIKSTTSIHEPAPNATKHLPVEICDSQDSQRMEGLDIAVKSNSALAVAPSASAGTTKRPNPYLDDPSTNTRSPRRRKDSLSFLPKGSYIAMGNEFRKREMVNAALSTLDEPSRKLLPQAPPSNSDNDLWNSNVALNSTEITNKVLLFTKASSRSSTLDLPIYLTKRELRRRRKFTRQQKQQELRDRIRLGLDPPPPPKLKPSNVAAVLGAEFLKDPTKFDKLARDAALERRQIHEDNNLQRKLTPEQRWEKEQSKHEKSRRTTLTAAVVCLKNMSNRKHRHTLYASAKELVLTGAIIYAKSDAEFNLVVAEGGEREIEKFTQLLLSMIDWTSTESSSECDDDNCLLVWKGMLRQPHFNKWTAHELDKLGTQTFMRSHKALGYWYQASDLAKLKWGGSL